MRQRLGRELRKRDADALAPLGVDQHVGRLRARRHVVAGGRRQLRTLHRRAGEVTQGRRQLAQVAEGDDGLEIYLRGLVAALDGTDAVRLSATGPMSEAAEVGRRLAAELLDLGAADLMGERT